MNASKKRPSTTPKTPRTATSPGESPTALARLIKATARGCLLALISTILLSAITTGIAYATADPDALVVPLALCVLALSPLFGGFVTYRSCRTSPLLCGALTALALLFFYFLLSYLLPNELRGQWPSCLRWGLRGGVLAFSLIGAIMGAYAPKKRKKKKRR